MKVKYRNDLYGNYMLIEIPENTDTNLYPFKMLMKNKIAGVLSCQKRMEDGKHRSTLLGQNVSSRVPYGFYKDWVAATGISGYEAQISMYQPVYSKSSAAATVKEEIETWGKEHLCKTSTYLNDLKTLGFYL